MSSADELQHLLDAGSDADAPSELLASEAMQADAVRRQVGRTNAAAQAPIGAVSIQICRWIE